MLSKTRIIARTLSSSYTNGRLLYSSYKNLPLVEDFKPTISGYEVSRSPEEWKFVERLLPPTIVPEPSLQESYQTNWKPPTAKLGDHPYYLKRTRNHMLPVYLQITHRGTRHVTEIKGVEGDLHKLGEELKKLAEKSSGRVAALQTNELTGIIRLKGDHVTTVKDYLTNLGF